MSAYNKQIKDYIYRVYITDALKIISENTAKTVNGEGAILTMRYYDMIAPKKEEVEEKGAEEIISNIKNKIKELGKEPS